MSFDPRTIGKPVYEALNQLRTLPNQDETRLKEQKNQAVELYTYLSTWGMLRLKAEEKALSQEGKKQVVKAYFQCLQDVVNSISIDDRVNSTDLIGDSGLSALSNLSTDEYLGLTGLGLAIAQEFSFWATAIYHDVKGEA